jgi:hypothetical protein
VAKTFFWETGKQSNLPPHTHLANVKENNRNSQDAPALTNGLRKCGIYTQWNFMQP